MDLLEDEKSWVNISNLTYKFWTYDRNVNVNANKEIRINLHIVKDEL